MTARSKWTQPGQIFGRLTAVQRVDHKRWLFRCECGAERIFHTGNVRTGHTKSCGCFNLEALGLRATHGHARKGQWTRTYRIWRALFDRCYRPSSVGYKDYGGRGIIVCDRWHEYVNFSADMGVCPDGHSIDRVNNNGNYEPGNCRWATPKEQAANRRENPNYLRNRHRIPA